MLWIALRHGHNWYHLDEWALIDRTMSPNGWLTGAFTGFLGHLYIGSYVIYRLQREWFGLEGHQLVFVAFCASLGALQVTIAAVLHRLELPTLLALLAATVVTYFGPGAQNMSWAFMMGANFALALCFGAAFVALREHRNASGAVVIAVLLVLSVGADSGVATFGAVFVGILVVGLWPRRLVLLALALPLMAHVAWLAFGDNSEYVTAPLEAVVSFGWHLFALSAGGLVGGGETQGVIDAVLRGPGSHVSSSPTIPLAGETVGAIVLALAIACAAVGFAKHRVSRKVTVNLIAGSAAAVFGTAVLAQTRTYIIPTALIPGSRFVQWVAVFLLVAFAPVIAATVRPVSPRVGRYVYAASAAALIAVLVVNLDQVRPIRQFEETWGAVVKSPVRQTVWILTEGCGGGRKPDARAEPTAASPQITVRLVRQLLDEGALSARFGIRATADVRDVVCGGATPKGPPGRTRGSGG